MTRPVKFVLLTILALEHWAACAAERPPGWSFWGTADGMKESYTSSIAVHRGRVWIKHGSVTGMNILNGYGVGEMADPGGIGKIQTSPDGTLWSWTGQHLSRYHDSRWDSFNVEEVTRTGFLRSDPEQFWVFTSKSTPSQSARIWVVGLDVNHALILLPDQILEFDVLGKKSKVILSSQQTGLGSFTSMRQVSNDIWITGHGGIGKWSMSDST